MLLSVPAISQLLQLLVTTAVPPCREFLPHYIFPLVNCWWSYIPSPCCDQLVGRCHCPSL